MHGITLIEVPNILKAVIAGLSVLTFWAWTSGRNVT
jgi:hypothetical protein